MSDTPDLSKIVNLIMENPSLIEEISALAKSSGAVDSGESAPVVDNTESISEPASAAPKRSLRRHELINAMKPYLSEKRGKTVDSVIAIADILELMRR